MTTCYACDNQPTSDEHVPPRLLFPKMKDANGNRNLRLNLITVPSCDAHNSQKSKDDEYLLWVLASNACANEVGIQQALTKLGRAYVRRPKLGNSILRTARAVTISDSHSGTRYGVPELDLDGPRFAASMNLIARGLYFHHFGKRWDGSVHVHADFLAPHDMPDLASVDADRVDLFNLAEQLFASEPLHGQNPDAFWHKVHRPAAKLDCLMRFAFYGGCKATAFFG